VLKLEPNQSYAPIFSNEDVWSVDRFESGFKFELFLRTSDFKGAKKAKNLPKGLRGFIRGDELWLMSRKELVLDQGLEVAGAFVEIGRFCGRYRLSRKNTRFVKF